MKVNFFSELMILLLFIAAGGFFAYAGILGLRDHWKARDFPETPGKIVVSKTERHPGVKLTKPVVESYVVKYRYVVDGTEYENGRYSFVSLPWDRDQLDEYPEGKEVTVFYDPENPGNSVLSRENGFFYYVLLFQILPAAFYACTLFPLCSILDWIDKRRRIGFMYYSKAKGLKILKAPALSPLTLAGLGWFFISLMSALTAMVLESSTASIMFGIVGFAVFVTLIPLGFQREKKRNVWIVDPLQRTLNFTDPGAPDGRTTVRLDHLSDLQIRPGRSAYAEFWRKWIDSSTPAVVDDLYVVYYDPAGQVRSGKLVSIAGTFRNELEFIRQWLASECRLPLRPTTT